MASADRSLLPEAVEVRGEEKEKGDVEEEGRIGEWRDIGEKKRKEGERRVKRVSEKDQVLYFYHDNLLHHSYVLM